jgi:hypothetical protein
MELASNWAQPATLDVRMKCFFVVKTNASQTTNNAMEIAILKLISL